MWSFDFAVELAKRAGFAPVHPVPSLQTLRRPEPYVAPDPVEVRSNSERNERAFPDLYGVE